VINWHQYYQEQRDFFAFILPQRESETVGSLTD